MDAVTLKLPASGQIRSAPNKRKLTDRKVASLKPKARAYTVWDTAQRGLGLRIQPSGHKSWVVVYRHNRKPRWLTFPLVPVRAAREKAAEVTLAVMRGQDPAPKNHIGAIAPFSLLAQRYVDEHAKLKNKSWQHASKLVQRYLIPSWGAVTHNPDQRERTKVLPLSAKISAPQLANQVRLAASAIFTWCISQDIVQQNPCRGIEGNPAQSRERILSDAEVKMFWQAFAQAGNAGRALRILLLTGVRPGEVAHMQHHHIKDFWWDRTVCLFGKADPPLARYDDSGSISIGCGWCQR